MVSWTKVWSILVAVAVLLLPTFALAQKPVTVHVIALDSDDASEDQADALTAAMRQRVRMTPSLLLAESNRALSTLLPALKCPSRPDSACLQRIGDQLKTDRFFWGNVVKSSVAHQVVAEVHLWTRGKPEQVAKETFSDNLKDQNDDALKRIAVQLFDRLTGEATQGTVIIKVTGAQVGTVIVDGKPITKLTAGMATIQVGSGSHTIEVQSDGYTGAPQTVNVVVNVESDLTFDMKANAVVPVEPSKPGHPKRVIGFVTLAVAGAAAVGAIVTGAIYASDSGTWHNYASGVPSTVTDLCTNAASKAAYALSNGVSNRDACDARSTANTVWPVGWALGGAAVALGIVGVVLVISDKPSKEEGAPPPMALRITPTFGPGGGGVSALLTF